MLPRLALLLLLLQPSCFFSGSTALRNTSSCFSVVLLCFSESSKQMRAANKSEKGSPLLPFALLDLPLPWQLLSLLSRSRFPGKSPARKARPSSRQIPIWISPYERLRARLVLRPADGLFRERRQAVQPVLRQRVRPRLPPSFSSSGRPSAAAAACSAYGQISLCEAKKKGILAKARGGPVGRNGQASAGQFGGLPGPARKGCGGQHCSPPRSGAYAELPMASQGLKWPISSSRWAWGLAS